MLFLAGCIKRQNDRNANCGQILITANTLSSGAALKPKHFTNATKILHCHKVPQCFTLLDTCEKGVSSILIFCHNMIPVFMAILNILSHLKIMDKLLVVTLFST